MDKTDIYDVLNRAYFSADPHEKDVLAHLPILLKNDSLIVDVGASLGQYTRTMCQAVRNSDLRAIEADPTRAEQLERNCREWAQGSTNKIAALHMALTDHAGDVSFFVTNSDVSGGLTPHEATRTVEWEEITIPSSTLDDLFPECSPDFVKIDVEGAELAVLRGAKRILAQDKTIFLIELHDWSSGSHRADEVKKLMRNAGYASVSFFGQPLFVKSRRLWLKLKLMELRDVRRLLRRLQGRLRRRGE
jgi:FkbM family methyltransferase